MVKRKASVMTQYYKPAKQPYRKMAVAKRTGGYANASSDLPTPFTLKPWNFYTYESTTTTSAAGGAQEITGNGIIDKLREALQLKDDASIRIKILRAQTWSSAGGTLCQPDAQTQYFDLTPSRSGTGTEQFPRSSQRDVGSWSTPAKSAYSFPPVDKRELLTKSDSNDTRIMRTLAVAKDTKITSRVHILWQSGAV